MKTNLHDHFRQLEAPYPSPMPDEDVQDVAGRAIEDLAGQRHLAWLGDGPVQVHLIASLSGELQFRLDEAIVLAADQDTDLTGIPQLAGIRRPPIHHLDGRDRRKRDRTYGGRAVPSAPRVCREPGGHLRVPRLG